MKQERNSEDQVLIKFHLRLFYESLLFKGNSKRKAKEMFSYIRNYYMGALNLFRSYNLAKKETLNHYQL